MLSIIYYYYYYIVLINIFSHKVWCENPENTWSLDLSTMTLEDITYSSCCLTFSEGHFGH